MLTLPRFVAAALLLCAALSGFALAQQKAEYKVLASTPDRKFVQLDNGLVVIAQRIPGAPVASVQTWVQTGSIYEGVYNGAGLSHFLEHLLSGGTTSNRTEDQTNEILGRIGAQVNAATSLDNVHYYIDTSSEHAAAAVDLMSDWMLNSTINPEEFAREQAVIQREFDMGRGEPSRIFWKCTQQACYRVHPARHPTIGYIDEFMKITRDDIYKFYKQMYVPNNMVFTVAGDIDPQAIVDQVAKLWKDAKRGPVPAVIFPIEPTIEDPREMTGHADIDRPRLRLAWPGVRLRAEHDYALDLLAQILGEGELARLVQSVRNEQRLVTSIDAYNQSFSWGPGFFGVDAVVAKDKLEEAKAAILKEIERLKQAPVTEEELQRAKNKTVARVVYAAQSANATAGRLASDFIHTGNPDYLDHYAKEIQKVTAGEVMAAAHKFLRPNRLITIRLLPQTGPPEDITRPEEEKLSRPVETELVELNNDKLVRQFKELEQTEATAAKVERSPVTMHTLDNGLRVLIQRDTRLPIVAMQWYHLGGLMADEPGHEGVANAMAQMMIKGAGEMSADDIARQLEDLGADISTSSGNSTFIVAGQSLSEDWPRVLGIMSEVIQNPTFPADEWERMKLQLLAAIASINDVWYTELRSNFLKTYFGEGHPWSQPTLGRKEVVEGLTADGLKEFHRNRIAAKNGVLAIFGDVEEAEVLARVKELLGDLPAEAEVAFEAKDHGPIDTGIVQVVTAKPTTAVQIGYGPGMARNNPDYAASLVMNRVLDAFPVGWLDQALRGEGPGLVYAVGAGMMTGVSPGYFSILFNTQQPTLNEAMGRALRVVDRIKTETVDSATLERARTAVLVGEALSRQTNSQRAGAAALDELYGLGYDESDRFIAQIRAVTPEQIKAVAHKYLAEPVAVILTPSKVDPGTLPSLTGSAAPAPAPEAPAKKQPQPVNN